MGTASGAERGMAPMSTILILIIRLEGPWGEASIRKRELGIKKKIPQKYGGLPSFSPGLSIPTNASGNSLFP
jgi:hypothetical protein